MRNYLIRNRDLLEAAVLAHLLPFVAGAVNASGLFIVGAYTSHVTGSVARIGDDLAQRNVSGALRAAFLVAGFYLGASTAEALAGRPRPTRHSHYARALAVEAGTLLAVMLLGIAEPQGAGFLTMFTTGLLCFAMGIQNALVTRLSGAIVRTTHVTGVVTDMGIETVQAVRWLRATAAAQPGLKGYRALFRMLVTYRRQPELAQLRLHTAILTSFLAGAVIGPSLYLRYGYWSMLCPVGVLGLLMGLDLMIGLRFQAGAPSPEQPTEP